MGCCGKSSADIAERRAIKQRFVAMALNCAVAAPRAVTGNGVLTGTESGNVTVAAGTFYNGLDEDQIIALRTAKGCNRPPAGVEQPGYLTLADFLKIPTLDVAGAGCMAAFVHDLVLWGKQVIALNPHSFSAADRDNFNTRILAAIQANLIDINVYKLNPKQYNEPSTPEEAMYWYLMDLAMILAEEKEEGLANWNKNKRPILAALNARVSKTVAAEFRNNPNIVALASEARFEQTARRAVTEYGAPLLLTL